jgi:predicted nucleic acid-binding protein
MKTMSTERIFIDSNILLYLISGETPKAETAETIVHKGACISVQVLNEFAAVARRKYKRSWDDVSNVLGLVKANCEVMPLTLETHERALEIAQETTLRIYDACIVAAAELAGCDVLLTEDLNHGQRIGSITIRNPFA